ncbi:MAG TPA: hypothetical protein VLF91_03250 [Candidatus Saccharimonadales bacterium]|nr:hypothetical protein [Candidatus Saccharimonadales bacterium]
MSFITKVVQHVRHATAQQLTIAGIFALALLGTITLGLHVRSTAGATAVRDCSLDSLDYAEFPAKGDCGATTAPELIADIKHNVPSDLQSLYADQSVGLNSSVYQKFSDTAVDGVVNRDGTVVVNGQTVLTGAFTVGRDNFGNNRKPITLGGHTYYFSPTQDSFASGVTQIPVMVMFTDQGVSQIIIEKPCGNIVGGMPKLPSATCKALQAQQSTSNPNSWTFSTDATFGPNTTLNRVVYHFSDGRADIVMHTLGATAPQTFAKDVDVTATVYANVPGNHVIVAKVIDCKKHIPHTAPMFVCTALVASAIDDKTFRFTVKTAQDKNTTVKSADFSLDSGTAITVTTKDAQGNLFKEYTFSDTKTHNVAVTVFFNTLEGVKSDAGHCTASATPKKTPVCEVPGHIGQPIDSNCGFCKPGVPIGSADCAPPTTPPSTLVDTGPAGTGALFVGTVIAGFFGHKFYLGRRARRAAALVEPIV